LGSLQAVRRIFLLLALLLVAGPAPAAVAGGPAATERALARQMRFAGPGSSALAVDLDTGARIYAARPAVPRIPASVEKLYTTSTALRVLGVDARLVTSVSADAPPDERGTVAGNVYLRGAGDPTLGRAELDALADRLAAAGVFEVTGSIVGDESVFDARRGPPSSGYRTSVYVGPLSALSFNRGLTGERAPYFQAQPARFTARAYTRRLRALGVWVAAPAVTGTTPPTAVPLTAWESPPMVDLARLTNQDSDNFNAETLIKALGAQVTGMGTTAAGAGVVTAEMGELGIRPTVVDGSGLSRFNRTSPEDVVTLLATMRDEAAFTGSLAVAGRSGTLERRMRGTAAQDRCRGKTGTVIGVSALAGYCTTAAGADVAFAFLMNGVNPAGAHALQDRMAAALAGYEPRPTVQRHARAG